MKVVLDSNVLLSGLMAPEGTPGRILAAWFEACFEVVMSLEQLAEIGRARSHPKIRRKLKWDERRIEQCIRQLDIQADYAAIFNGSTFGRRFLEACQRS